LPVPDASRLSLLRSEYSPEPGKTQALRLFCTSSEYYPGDGVNVIPMDLPNNYDITLNSHQLKLAKGLKGKAGSTAPVDLMQTTSMGTDALNRAEGLFNMVQFSHTGPTMNKKTKTPKVSSDNACHVLSIARNNR
jgi:hypothetical protein